MVRQKEQFRRFLAGFTLVELLVVIGIIALLISILLPALSRAKEAGNQIKCMANLRTIGQALVMYAGDYKGSLPIGELTTGETIGPTTADPAYGSDPTNLSTDWTVLVAYELNKGAGSSYVDPNTKNFNTGTRGFFLCPTAPQSTNYTANILTDYSSHPRIIPDLGTTDGTTTFIPPFTKTWLRPYRIARIKRSSEMGLIFDASVANSVGSWNAHVVANGFDNNGINVRVYMTDTFSAAVNPGASINTASGGGSQPFTPAYYNTDSEQNLANIRFRHASNKKANVLMADGHVQAFTYNPLTHQSDLLERNINVNK
jgi:prepilin-type processing-associated H-X9-DG protein/prepilin-type N-terminal cleavage/methylation domain-containing protein